MCHKKHTEVEKPNNFSGLALIDRRFVAIKAWLSVARSAATPSSGSLDCVLCPTPVALTACLPRPFHYLSRRPAGTILRSGLLDQGRSSVLLRSAVLMRPCLAVDLGEYAIEHRWYWTCTNMFMCVVLIIREATFHFDLDLRCLFVRLDQFLARCWRSCLVFLRPTTLSSQMFG